jgi:hypothetical protein
MTWHVNGRAASSDGDSGVSSPSKHTHPVSRVSFLTTKQVPRRYQRRGNQTANDDISRRSSLSFSMLYTR